MVERRRYSNPNPGREATQFKDGRVSNGRPLGAKNKVTKTLRECILRAATLEGDLYAATQVELKITTYTVEYRTKVEAKGDTFNPNAKEFQKYISELLAKAKEEVEGGLTGYIQKVMREDMALAVRLLEKVLPLTLESESGVVPVFSIPPDIIARLTVQEITLLSEKIIPKFEGSDPKLLEHMAGDAAAYAKEIGAVEVRTHG